MIDLSIIIVNWNTKDYLVRCIDSLLQAGEKNSQEVLVIDNGSCDGSADEVKRMSSAIHVIENRENLGFAGAVNQGLKKSTGEYVLLLNPDTEMKDGCIETLLSFMDGHPAVGVAGGQLLNRDGSRQNSIANFPTLATELLNKNLLRWLSPERFPGKEKKYHGPIEVESVIGACMMVRREAIERVGPLDEDYFLFLEETDWCYRMKRAGWEIFHLPSAEVYHFQGKSAEKDKKRAKVEYYRSRYRYFKKHRGDAQWLILHIGLIIKLTVECVSTGLANLLTFFTVKKWKRRLSVYAYLLWWHLKGCPGGMGLKESFENSHCKINDAKCF